MFTSSYINSVYIENNVVVLHSTKLSSFHLYPHVDLKGLNSIYKVSDYMYDKFPYSYSFEMFLLNHTSSDKGANR